MTSEPTPHVHDGAFPHAHIVTNRERLWSTALGTTHGTFTRWRQQGLDHAHYWPDCTLTPGPRTMP